MKIAFLALLTIVNLIANPLGEYNSKTSDITIKKDLSYVYFTSNSKGNSCELSGKLKKTGNTFTYEESGCKVKVIENNTNEILFEAEDCNSWCGMGVYIENENMTKKDNAINQTTFEKGLIDYYNIFSEAKNNIQKERLTIQNNKDLKALMKNTDYQFKNICGKLYFKESNGYKKWSITIKSDKHKSIFNNFGWVEYTDNYISEDSKVFQTISEFDQYGDDEVCIDGYFGESKYKKLTKYSFYRAREVLRHYSNNFAIHIESLRKK